MALLVFTERLELTNELSPESPQMLCQALQSQVLSWLCLPITAQRKTETTLKFTAVNRHTEAHMALGQPPQLPQTSRCMLSCARDAEGAKVPPRAWARQETLPPWVWRATGSFQLCQH